MKQKFVSLSFGLSTLLLLLCSSCKKEKTTSPGSGNNNGEPKPIANASFLTLSEHAPVLLKANNLSQYAASYKWYVGGTLVSTDQHPELVLRNVGNQTVRLVSTNSKGDSSVKNFTHPVTKHPRLYHHFAFSGNFDNGGSVSTVAGSIHYAFAPDRKQVANSAVYFNGINTFVTLPNGLSAALQDSMSISLWFKPEDLNKAGVVFGFQSGALNTAPVHFAPVIYHGADKNLYPAFWNGRFAEGINASNILNNWVHMVVAANATGQDIYVNGEKVKTVAGRAADAHMPFAYLGATYTNNGWTGLRQGANYFKGWIDDVRVYSKKIGQNEVRALHQE